MNEIILTKNARKLLRKLLKHYRKRLSHGASSTAAAYFGGSEEIHRDILPKWSFDAVDAACSELLRQKLVSGFRADGVVYSLHLSDRGIAFSESSSGKTASSFFGWVWELLKAIQSLLPL